MTPIAFNFKFDVCQYHSNEVAQLVRLLGLCITVAKLTFHGYHSLKFYVRNGLFDKLLFREG